MNYRLLLITLISFATLNIQHNLYSAEAAEASAEDESKEAADAAVAARKKKKHPRASETNKPVRVSVMLKDFGTTNNFLLSPLDTITNLKSMLVANIWGKGPTPKTKTNSIFEPRNLFPDTSGKEELTDDQKKAILAETKLTLADDPLSRPLANDQSMRSIQADDPDTLVTLVASFYKSSTPTSSTYPTSISTPKVSINEVELTIQTPDPRRTIGKKKEWKMIVPKSSSVLNIKKRLMGLQEFINYEQLEAKDIKLFIKIGQQEPRELPNEATIDKIAAELRIDFKTLPIIVFVPFEKVPDESSLETPPPSPTSAKAATASAAAKAAASSATAAAK